MFEVINNYRDSIDGSNILDRLSKKFQYFVVSMHREEKYRL